MSDKDTKDQKDELAFKPNHIEEEILIPYISNHVAQITKLFEEMEKIFQQIQTDQKYLEDFFVVFSNYYHKRFVHLQQIITQENTQQEVNYAKELLFNGIESHLNQYLNALRSKELKPPKEKSFKEISQYVTRVESVMINLKTLRNKILNIVLPATSITFSDPKTGKTIDNRFSFSAEGVTQVSLLPFDTILREIVLFCDNGLQTIDSWKKSLIEREVQETQKIVSYRQVESATKQERTSLFALYIQILLIFLSLLFLFVGIFFDKIIDIIIDALLMFSYYF